MFRIINAITFFIVAFGMIIAADKEIKTINKIGHGIRNNQTESRSQSREEMIWEENFENDGEGWSFGPGWELTETTYHSDTHSALSPNNDANMNANFNLLSPPITLPEIESDEKMDFGFWLNVDTPDVDGDGDDYLDDYYSISLLDLGALAWHASSTDAFDDNSYWCGDEEVGGYLDSWVQFLDTPSFTIPENGTLTVMIGGEKKNFDKVSHIIDCYSKKMKLLGKAGNGQLAKMVNQICIAGLVQGLSEGINFGIKAGLNMEEVIEVISKGAAQSWQMENRYKTMIEDKFDFGFAVDWMRKDLKIALEEAKKNNSLLPITKIVDQYYGDVQKLGGKRWDTSSLIKRLRK